MPKKYILLAAIAAVMILGVVILAVVISTGDDFVHNITLAENGRTMQKLEFSVSGLAPGGSREYTLNLKSQVDAHYSIALDFAEQGDGALKNFVDVTILCGEQSHTYSLADLFEGKTTQFDLDIGRGRSAVITITYSMPQSVGNEAQGATADFVINLTAERV